MYEGFKLGACLPTFASCADRYCLSGYGRGGTTMEEMLSMAKKVDGLDGLELVGNWHINDKNIATVMKLFRDHGFSIPMIVPDLWTQAKWGRGSLAAADQATRREAVAEVKKCMDWAAEAGLPLRGRLARPGRRSTMLSRPTSATPGNGCARAWPSAPPTRKR